MPDTFDLYLRGTPEQLRGVLPATPSASGDFDLGDGVVASANEQLAIIKLPLTLPDAAARALIDRLAAAATERRLHLGRDVHVAESGDALWNAFVLAQGRATAPSAPRSLEPALGRVAWLLVLVVVSALGFIALRVVRGMNTCGPSNDRPELCEAACAQGDASACRTAANLYEHGSIYQESFGHPRTLLADPDKADALNRRGCTLAGGQNCARAPRR